MKNKLIRFCNTMSCFLSGSIFSSLVITKSDTWYYTLPLCLVFISLSNMLKEIE